MTNIKWNEYTWYSRLLALIVFIILIPVLCFYIGIRYEQTIQVLNDASTIATSSPAVSWPVATSTQPGTPSTPVVAGSSYTITNSDMGKTLVFKKGQSFTIALGTLKWTLNFTPAGIVSRENVATTTDAEQGVYAATAVGTTQVSGTGAPHCNPNQACPMFLADFQVTIQVTN